MFNNGCNDEFHIFQAKKELNLLTEEEKGRYKFWIQDFE
jgi:hypothetical protein